MPNERPDERPDERRGTPTLVGVPYDASSSFLRGAAAAPPAIRRELRSDSYNMWSEQLVDLGADGAFRDAGDLALGAGTQEAGTRDAGAYAAHARDAITRGVAEVYARGDRALVLGGDHSITYPVLRAVRPHYPALSILHFDAHPDLYDVFEGDRYSHACPFARIMEERLADQLVQVGIRAMSGAQRPQVDRFGVDVIDMRRWLAGERYALRHPVYVSLDVDAIDPAFAPGVSHREAGGLSVRDVIAAIQAIDQPIVGADLVEYNPSRDLGEVTAPVCAKLVKELIAGMHLHPV